ncbi:MAG TPA: PfkB family carbohydrate kinase [Pirellulales bacterium]|nr:PfkB family carbohydrate kinase [Pirellulales bacterium]
MIVAAGLTPAWQQILRFDSLGLGEVNRAVEAHWCASGKVFNVGIALSRLGAECRLISPIGQDVAERVLREFENLGVRSRLIRHTEPTRVCTTLLESATGTVTELVENARPLATEFLGQFVAAWADECANADVVVLSGSLPEGTPTTLYRDLLRTTRSRAVLDARGPELLAALECRPFLVKPNREELVRTLGRPLDDDQALVAGMRELNERGAEWVVVTEGKRAVWASSREGEWRLQPLSLPRVINPIGCGDCLAAGIAWAISEGCEPLECIRVGMAAAAQNAGALLPGRLDPADALGGARRVQVEKL